MYCALQVTFHVTDLTFALSKVFDKHTLIFAFIHFLFHL